MLLATILLMCSVPQTGDITNSLNESPAAVSGEASNPSSFSDSLPSMPTPKAETTDADGAGSVPVSAAVTAAAIEPGTPGRTLQPAKPAFKWQRESPKQRKLWFTLLVTSHGAAGFDAWTTQRAVSQGNTEANPFLRPFAGSNAIYAATQISPVVMDFIGKRMMTSQYPWLRRLWWLPQAAGSGFSIGAGVHNMRYVH